MAKLLETSERYQVIWIRSKALAVIELKNTKLDFFVQLGRVHYRVKGSTFLRTDLNGFAPDCTPARLRESMRKYANIALSNKLI